MIQKGIIDGKEEDITGSHLCRMIIQYPKWYGLLSRTLRRRVHIRCSFGLVSRPIRVSEFSLTRADVSRDGAFILRLAGSGLWKEIPFPFSAAENRWFMVLSLLKEIAALQEARILKRDPVR